MVCIQAKLSHNSEDTQVVETSVKTMAWLCGPEFVSQSQVGSLARTDLFNKRQSSCCINYLWVCDAAACLLLVCQFINCEKRIHDLHQSTSSESNKMFLF